MAFEDWFLARARVSSKSHKGISLDDKMTFFQQLGALVSSGTPLLQSLQIAAEQCQSTRLQTILHDVAGRVAAGCTLRESLGGHPQTFEDHWVELIGTGEISGNMDSVLHDLNQQIREMKETRRQIGGALIYPVILLCVAVAVVIIMLWFVVPTFGNMFEEMGAELPGITQFVISASNVVASYGLIGMVLAIVLAFLFRRYMRSEEGKRRVGAMALAVPMVGELMVQSAMYRFASNLALLLKSGVPMLDTLSAMAAVFHANPVYRDAILRAQRRVAAGCSLADALAETDLFTNMMTHMIRIGEESAQLPAVMEQTAPYYKEKLNGFIGKVTKLLEPTIIIFMGGTIAVVMLAIYIPMFDMAGNVK